MIKYRLLHQVPNTRVSFTPKSAFNAVDMLFESQEYGPVCVSMGADDLMKADGVSLLPVGFIPVSQSKFLAIVILALMSAILNVIQAAVL